MINKQWLSILILLLTLSMSACMSNTEISSTETASMETQTVEGEVDETSQLILGTLMLDGTSQEITENQAQNLLPLWELYQSMFSEDTTATEELSAIIKQIKSIFTEEQLTIMADFDYSNPMATLSELGFERFESFEEEDVEGLPWSMPEGFDFEDMPENMNPENRGNGGNFDRENAPQRSDGEGGTGMGEGGGFNMGENIDPDAVSTAQAERGGSSRSNFQNQMFITILIKYLETKTTP